MWNKTNCKSCMSDLNSYDLMSDDDDMDDSSCFGQSHDRRKTCRETLALYGNCWKELNMRTKEEEENTIIHSTRSLI